MPRSTKRLVKPNRTGNLKGEPGRPRATPRLGTITTLGTLEIVGCARRPGLTDPEWSGGSLYVDKRVASVATSPAELWRVIEGIGGDNGWYSWVFGWWVRGWLDRLVGGVGLRRGRRDPSRLRRGDAVDFWRVDEIEPGHLLRLRAEMRLPGRAWLEFRVEPEGERSTYTQRAVFQPRGLAGHLYWWAVAPFHGVVFGGMARNIPAASTVR